MLKFITGIFVLGLSVTLNAQTVKPIYVVHVNLGSGQLAENVVEELGRNNPEFKNRPVIVLRPNIDLENNPFFSSKWGRQTGLTRPGGKIDYDKTPILSPEAAKWFEDLEAKDIHPEVFIINGHHLVSMGFESDDTTETKYISQFGNPIELSKRNVYFPAVIRSKDYYPAVKRFFENVKLVFIGGCEGLANLEPKEFGLSGRALTPQEIYSRYLDGQKKLVLGSATEGTGLAGYKADLVRVYPGSYSDNQEEEVCIDPVQHIGCEVFNVNRILPESGLWDGGHMYNEPYQMKRAFPNAYAIFGFATPSPISPGFIWKQAFSTARAKTGLNNFFQPLLSDSVTNEYKKSIIQKIRLAWTKATYDLNARRSEKGQRINRISGSITPAYPDLDQNGIYAYENGFAGYKEAPAFAPYEVRDRKEEAPAALTSLVQSKAPVFEVRPVTPEKVAPIPSVPVESVKLNKEDISKLIPKVEIKVSAPVSVEAPAMPAAPLVMAEPPTLAKKSLFMTPEEFKKLQQSPQK